MPKATPTKKPSTSKHKAGAGGGGGSHMKILNTVAALKSKLGKDSVERKKLSMFTGIQGKSTIANALTKLKNNGWLEVSPGEVSITQEGMDHADSSTFANINVPTTNKEHHDTVKATFKLKARAIELFDFLSDGRTYQKKEAADAIGCKMNSTFANLLTSLKKVDVIEFDKSTIRLTDDMFPVIPRAE